MADAVRVVVVGGGIFGLGTALALQRSGASVALIESWDPGHARASSGGETRVLRLAYPRGAFLRLARESRDLWREEEARLGLAEPLFVETGLLWMAAAWTEVETSVIMNFESQAIPHEHLSQDDVARRFPQVATDGLVAAIYEPGAGYLTARRACRVLARAFRAGGGQWLSSRAVPAAIRGGELEGVELADGSVVCAHAYVFACGPWLPALFPEVLDGRLRVTRQEVHTFGTPASDRRYDPGALPVWAWHGDRFWYGVPGDGAVGGFKIADDTRGPEFDPDAGERLPEPSDLGRTRGFLAERFPGMAGAPVIASHVCQYTETADGRFLLDQHPEAENAWIVGGGSGHGFKHGLAVGRRVAGVVLGDRGRASLDGEVFQTFGELSRK